METLSQKPSFRKARRCLVLADAFFEWQWLDPKGKGKNIALPIPMTTPLPLLDFGMNGLIDKQEIIRSLYRYDRNSGNHARGP